MQELSDRLPRTFAAIQQGIDLGWHLGAQLYASIRGRPVADFAIGESKPGVAMTTDSIMLWLSSGKPITATAILQLCEQGRLALEDPVGRHLPEFACRGKEPITLMHLLTHTGGFRWVDDGWPQTNWGEIIERICDARLEEDWIPGRKAGYHIASSWYVLGEIVCRLSGQTLSDYVRQRIFLPLGMNESWIGMPAEEFDAYGDRLGIMQRTERPGLAPHQWSSKSGATHCAPGGNAHGPIRQLAYFYEALLQGGQRNGERILQPPTVINMTARRRVGMFDQTFKHIMDWGLGLIVDSNRYGQDTVPYGYGKYSSEDTFGHGGSQSSVGFADPRHQLAAAVVFNGMPGEQRHQKRMRAILESLYEDLGLAHA